LYEGYIRLGVDELANVARFKKYIEDYAAGFPWVGNIPQAEADALRAALGDAAYSTPAADNAPWYDPGDPASANFYGLYITDIQGAEDDSRVAVFTQSIGDGGTVGPTRRATKQFRVKALLAARDEFAMESGLRWLNRTIDPDDCPGGDCGTMTLCTYAAAPGYIDGCNGFDYATPIARTNEVLDPAVTNSAAVHWTAKNGMTFGATGLGGVLSAPAAVNAGTELLGGDATMLTSGASVRSGSIRVTNLSNAPVGIHFGIRQITNGVPGAPIPGPGITIAAGATQVVSFTNLPLTAANTGYSLSLLTRDAMPAGTTIRVSQAISEPAAAPGSFFSGATPATAQAAYLWLGRAYDSPSRLYTVGVDPARHMNGVTAISGATINTKRKWPGGVLREVEFGLEAQTPYVFTAGRRLLDSTSFLAGTQTYYDYGILQAINHVFDPRAIVAGTRTLFGNGGAAGTLTYNIASGASAGIPRFAQGNGNGMRLSVTTAGTSIDVAPTTPIASSYRKATAGTRYVASVHAVAGGAATMGITVGIIWYDAAGSQITTTFDPTGPYSIPGSPGLNGFKRASFAATAPAGTAYAGVIIRVFGTAAGGALTVGQTMHLNWWQLELARALPGKRADDPTEWFDADFVNTRPAGDVDFSKYYDVQQVVMWEGAARASASFRFLSWMCDYDYIDGRWVYVNSTAQLQDPLTGALPTPPAAPTINPTIPDPGLGGWTRSAYTLPAFATQENGIAVPTLSLSVPGPIGNTPKSVRQLRIRFYANENNLAPADMGACDFCSEITLSYVQQGVTFVIDGETQSVSAIVGNATLPADNYVYGEDGGPVEWPELQCGIPYVMTIDQPRPTDGSAPITVAVQLDMTQRM